MVWLFACRTLSFTLSAFAFSFSSSWRGTRTLPPRCTRQARGYSSTLHISLYSSSRNLCSCIRPIFLRIVTSSIFWSVRRPSRAPLGASWRYWVRRPRTSCQSLGRSLRCSTSYSSCLLQFTCCNLRTFGLKESFCPIITTGI